MEQYCGARVIDNLYLPQIVAKLYLRFIKWRRKESSGEKKSWSKKCFPR